MIASLYRKIIQIGTQKSASDFDTRHIRTVNLFALLAVLTIGGFALLSGFGSQQYLRMSIQLTNITLTIMPIFIWHHFGYRLIGIYSLVIGICISIIIDATFGGVTEGHHYYFTVIAFSACLVFKPDERKHLIANWIITLVSWLILEVADYRLFTNLVQTNDKMIGYLNLLTSMIISAINATYFAQGSWKNELSAKQAAKMAALGEMSAGMAHEINNPLTIVTLGTEALKATDIQHIDPAKYNKNLMKITEATKRIALIVKSLRTFSRTNDADPLSLVPLTRIVESTVGLCGHRIHTSSLRIDTDFNQDLSVYCREAEMVQVLVNLINNSIDAIEGQTEKWLKIDATEKNGFTVICVTDSGNGIPQHISDKIMQPFFTTKEVGQGTGLGLSVCLGILQRYSGSFEIDHTCKNTRFVLKIPQCAESLVDQKT